MEKQEKGKFLTLQEEIYYNQLQESSKLLKDIKEEWLYSSSPEQFYGIYNNYYIVKTEEFLNKLE